LSVPRTNEERFLASCKNVGEADVRQKLIAGRFSDRRSKWASDWLEELENGKSDATKAEERSTRLLDLPRARNSVARLAIVLLTLVLLAGAGALVWSHYWL
jgi:hypothetical protein